MELTKPPSPVEVVNDRDANVFDFWSVVKDPADCQALVDMLKTTPNSKEHYDQCRRSFATCTDHVERARQYFVLTQQSFNGAFGKGWSRPTRPSDWKAFPNKISRLLPASDRLRGVTILNKHLRDVIPLFNGPEAVLYCDPPYPDDVRTALDRYLCEMTLMEQAEFVALADESRAMLIISGYAHPLYDDAFRLWARLEIPVVKHAARGGGQPKSRAAEVLWINPRCWAAMAHKVTPLVQSGRVRLVA